MKRLVIISLGVLLALCAVVLAAQNEKDEADQNPGMAHGQMSGQMNGMMSGPHGGKGPAHPDLFAMCDVDKDGVLSLDEFQGCHPNNKEMARGMFETLDADKDGTLTQQEISSHFQGRVDAMKRAVFKACDTDGDNMLNEDEFLQCLHMLGTGTPGKQGMPGMSGMPGMPGMSGMPGMTGQ